MKCLTDGNVVWMSPSFCIGDLVKEERRNPSPCFLRDFTWVVLLCQVPILALPQRVEVRENYSLVSLPFFSSENHNNIISFLACLLFSIILQILMTTVWWPQTACSLFLRHYPSKQGVLNSIGTVPTSHFLASFFFLPSICSGRRNVLSWKSETKRIKSFCMSTTDTELLVLLLRLCFMLLLRLEWSIWEHPQHSLGAPE